MQNCELLIFPKRFPELKRDHQQIVYLRSILCLYFIKQRNKLCVILVILLWKTETAHKNTIKYKIFYGLLNDQYYTLTGLFR